MEPSPGSDIGDCFDHACSIVERLGCVVNFDFNDVYCGVRPCDAEKPRDNTRTLFTLKYHEQLSSKSHYKICYANVP